MIVIASAEFTRPSDTTQYATGDVVGPVTTPAVMTFANVVPYNARYGIVRTIYLEKNTTGTTASDFLLHLYHTAPTPIADNSPMTMLYADRAKFIGTFAITQLTATVGFGAGGDAASNTVALTVMKDSLFKCVAGSRSIYGVLSLQNTYTPGSAEQFYVKIAVEYGD